VSDSLLKAIGGAVSDHNFRDALFEDFDETIEKFKLFVDEPTKAYNHLLSIIKGPNRHKVRDLMTRLEPYICGPRLENCWEMRPVPKPKPRPKLKPTGKKKKKS